MPLVRSLEENVERVKETLGVGTSFDVLLREFRIGGRDAALIFIDGLVKDKATVDVMAFLLQLDRADLAPDPIKKLVAKGLPYFELETVTEFDEVIDQVMAGP